MARQRRAFNYIPEYLRTDQNNREFSIADDVLFEPESATFLSGYIGLGDILEPEDLERSPLLLEQNSVRQGYQLSVGSAYLNPTTKKYESVAFYTDAVNQIRNNGGFVDNANRVFGTNYYAWTPPIDYDKHVNHARYYWVGDGNAEVNGEYITREPAGSQTIVYRVNGSTFDKIDVVFVENLSTVLAAGVIVEDVSTTNRYLYESDGTSWRLVGIIPVDTLPTSTEGYVNGDVLYVARTGAEYNRPLVWMYSAQAGRWIAQMPVVDRVAPEFAKHGMLWEDSSQPPARVIKKYDNGLWVNITYRTETAIIGTDFDQTYVYDISRLSDSDSWAKQNWWRHFEDLSAYDRSRLVPGDQAVRPIIEFWNGVEIASGSTRTDRHSYPQFKIYKCDVDTNLIIDSTKTSRIFVYRLGTGRVDPVLGFVPARNDVGEFVFDLVLEMDNPEIVGYKFYKDTRTGYVHSIWEKSLVELSETTVNSSIESITDYNVPRALHANADHSIQTEVSKSTTLTHMGSVIGKQTDFEGDQYGSNNYRWTIKDPIAGAKLIDPEQGMLRLMATLQRPELDIPDVIRFTAREYNRVLSRFVTRMNQLWDDATNIISDPAGNLKFTATQTVDYILSLIFVGRNETFPYYYSDMGTYLESRIDLGSYQVIDSTPKPIHIPSSPARTGMGPTFVPGSFTDNDGTEMLRGHDGTLIPSFGDGRDSVWLDLQNRFFSKVPTSRRTETSSFSTRWSADSPFVTKFYNNFKPLGVVPEVKDVVDDYEGIGSPIIGATYLSRKGPALANWDGSSWLTRVVRVDDMMLSETDGFYYVYNGIGVVRVNPYNSPVDLDYSTNEYRSIIRRDFERWTNEQNLDFTINSEFDRDDPFTWNYASAGVEGHYRGIYRRLYRTVRPHSHPWEIVHYSIEPEWWRTVYVPDSVDVDGTPRYGRSHAMWTNLQNGIVHPLMAIIAHEVDMVAPIPVDDDGELLDPITLGIIDQENLDMQRIDDGWVYGDGGPVEELFLNSSYGLFSTVMAGYLMKPALWSSMFWIRINNGIGKSGSNLLWRAPHIVHQDTLTRTGVADQSLHLNVSNGVVERHNGLNAWIAERIAILGKSPVDDFQKIVQNTVPRLIWQTSGFINKNRTFLETLSGADIPSEDVNVVLHQSKPAREEFCSGIYVIKERPGYRVFGFDALNPRFRVELPKISTHGGMVELREQFTAEINQHEFRLQQLTLPQNVFAGDTSRFAVIINGLKIRREFVRIVDAKTFSIDSSIIIEGGETIVLSILTAQSNPSTMMKKFTVYDVDFPYFSEGSGEIVDVEYGHYFETAKDVIEFMIGYSRYLIGQGWVFDQTEPRTGAIMDWLHGAKKFATWVLETNNPRLLERSYQEDFDMFFYSPIQFGGKFQSPFGQALNAESIQNGAYGVINKRGEPIPVDNTFTARVGEITTVSPVGASVVDGDIDIYGLRIYLSEIQHVVVLSDKTRFNQLIYDPVIDLYHKTLRVDTYRTNDWNGRLEANGFVVHGGDLLPNLEKQATDVLRLYSRFDPIDDPVKAQLARNLYGYSPTDQYMDLVDADERTRFDYHRAMIKAKGTVRAVKAFTRGTRVGPTNVLIYEDWAWKLSEFGDIRRESVQFKVDKNDIRDRVQLIRFGEETVAGDSVIEVPDVDRSMGDQESRWITIPKRTENGLAGWRFPAKTDGSPDYSDSRFYLKLYDRESGTTVIDHFVYDPINNKFDPSAMVELDTVSNYDPARYNTGDKAGYSNELIWGPQQVGHLWWFTFGSTFVDYYGLLPDYDLARREWGKALYFSGAITRTNNVVTVKFYNPYTGEQVAHGERVGTYVPITISGADQDDYNREVYASVTSSTEMQFSINSNPDATATGNIKVETSVFWVFEWVESPVPPDRWVEYTARLSETNGPGGVPMFYGHPTIKPSYTVLTTYSANGQPTTRYYFWVRNNTAVATENNLSGSEIASRLKDPTGRGRPWFAPIDSRNMLIYTDGAQVEDGYALELISDRRAADTHVEWTLVSEGSRFVSPPDKVLEKIADSLAGIDRLGNPVPDPILLESERYGTNSRPTQTVFTDRERAVEVWRLAVNKVMASRDFITEPTMVQFFQLDEEQTDSNPNGYWKRAAYRDIGYDKSVYESVGTTGERDYRAAHGRYAVGDLISVAASGRTDPWENLSVAEVYLYDGADFVQVGADGSTVELTTKIIDDGAILRRVFFDIISLLTHEEVNNLIFSVLHEMVRQHPYCDWFFKSSYITAHVFEPLRKAPFIRPNEVDAVFGNIVDVKPYHTKFRSRQITYTLSQDEEFNVSIEERPEMKITMTFDRLAVNVMDDHGWDTHSWDAWPWGWDKPIWEFANLGRDEYLLIGEGNATGTDTYVFPVYRDTRLYSVRVELESNGSPFDMANAGVSYTVASAPGSVTIMFNTPIHPPLAMKIYMASGFYDGSEPELGGDLDDQFSVTASSYFHHVARLITAKQYGSATEVDGTEERIETELSDQALITVRNEWSPDYAGWDNVPWDVDGWDTSSVVDVGPRVFYVMAGLNEVIAAGDELYVTSENITITTGMPPYVMGSNPDYHIAAVYKQAGGVGPFVLMTEGADYVRIEGLNHFVRFVASLAVNDVVRYVFNGWPLGQIGTFRITSAPGAYSIDLNTGWLTMPVDPAPGGSFTVNYPNDRVGAQKNGLSVRMTNVADDISGRDVAGTHTQWDSPGFETNRKTGLVVFDSTDGTLYTWNGTAWVSGTTLAGGDYIFIKRWQEIYQYNAPGVTRVYQIGDTLTTPPILDYPAYGDGILSATYVLGSLPTASTDYPEAYQVMTHPGT